MENRNWILGLLLTATVAVVGACGGVDTCEDTTCEQPNDYCEGNTAVQFSGAGVCLADSGACDYSAVKSTVDCGDQVCENGACVEPPECEAATDCTAAPAASCDTNGDLVTYEASCFENTCVYDPVTEACETGYMCEAGACVEEPECFEAADCTDVPADACNGEGQQVTYEPVCTEQGTCTYPETAADCATDLVCYEGGCIVEPECWEAVDCVAIPADSCNVDGQLVTWAPVCNVDGTCGYESTASHCGPDSYCAAGACLAADPAAQITAIYDLLSGSTQSGLALPVVGGVITYARPPAGSEGDGIFVQAGPTGPAMFLEVSPKALGRVAPGDKVSFTVTEVGGYPPATATAIADFQVIQPAAVDAATWKQDVSAATDLVSNLSDYYGELLTFDATISGEFGFAGSGFLAAKIDTAGIQNDWDLKLRMPTDLVDMMALDVGCSLTVVQGPMWAYSSTAQPSVYDPRSDVANVTCPAPEIASAYASGLDTVVLEFNRVLDPASVDAADFSIDNGLTISAAVPDGSTVTLTTSAQAPGTTYTVTLAGEVLDMLGTAGVLNDTATFDAFVLPQVYFSEYIEGSSSNKALEIYNAGSAAEDLSACVINVYSNGSTTAGNTYDLTGVTVPADDVWVICNSSIDPAYATGCDVQGGNATYFNGDDAVELVCAGNTLDVIGQIGTDPGSAWGTDPAVTANATLRRKCTVTAGDTDGSDAFDPSLEWDGFATDSFGDLGSYTCGSN